MTDEEISLDVFSQGSDEWYAMRRGKFTASNIHRLMGKRELGKTGETYILECVTEELGGVIPQPETLAMKYGKETEPYAKAHYMKAFDCNILDQPFYVADWCDEAGCSPDGLIEDTNEGVEFKAPFDPTNHIRHAMILTQDELKDQKPEYYWQVMMCIAVCKADKWYFVSYSESFTGPLRMTRLTVYPNQEDIKLLMTRIAEAVRMKHDIVQKIQKRLAQ